MPKCIVIQLKHGSFLPKKKQRKEKKNNWHFSRCVFTWQMKVFIWQKQRKRMRACPHADTYAMLTQLKRQHWARKHPNIIRNFLSATQSPPAPPCFFASSVAASSEAADLLCSGSLRRLMVEPLSTHCPISISKAGTDSYPSGRKNCIYILMST